jgi:hypothetical protein
VHEAAGTGGHRRLQRGGVQQSQRRPEPRSNKPIRIPARTAATGPRKSVKSHCEASSDRFSLTSGAPRPEMKAVGMGDAHDGLNHNIGQTPTIAGSIRYPWFAALLRWERHR